VPSPGIEQQHKKTQGNAAEVHSAQTGATEALGTPDAKCESAMNGCDCCLNETKKAPLLVHPQNLHQLLGNQIKACTWTSNLGYRKSSFFNALSFGHFVMLFGMAVLIVSTCQDNHGSPDSRAQ